ncbi:MAG: hypothetical protein QXF87_04830 [Thermofilaceae archaeon]
MRFNHPLLVYGVEEGELVELRGREAVFAQLCIQLYGMPVARFSGQGSRYFALKKEGKICAVAWIHRPSIFRPVFARFGIGQDNAYFLRRIATVCPGDHAVELLEKLCERLRQEGKEVLVALGLPDHSNALYRQAGFVEVGVTPRTGHPVFVKHLR